MSETATLPEAPQDDRPLRPIRILDMLTPAQRKSLAQYMEDVEWARQDLWRTRLVSTSGPRS
jgi:hypothetical protein